MASYGWHNRRAVGDGVFAKMENSSEGVGRETGHEGLRRAEQRTRFKEKRSYVEALLWNQKQAQNADSFEDIEPLCMKWEGF